MNSPPERTIEYCGVEMTIAIGEPRARLTYYKITNQAQLGARMIERGFPDMDPEDFIRWYLWPEALRT